MAATFTGAGIPSATLGDVTQIGLFFNVASPKVTKVSAASVVAVQVTLAEWEGSLQLTSLC